MAKNLMIQGTMSGAGKSLITAGILRVLRREGYKVVPFKSQNMALNSFVTADGGEMGRAQVVQAAAAGTAPTVDMNPILLKPTGQASSQVIVRGKPIGTMSAAAYYSMKQSLVPDIMEAYENLASDADIVVIEGAGSPVEINLREGDFVNMGLAQMLDAPVLLVGNIDPGGVFAQLLGTIELMAPDERARVKGLIINKFRGDSALLEPGLAMFSKYCPIPFAGIVPYLDVRLEEEDSLSARFEKKSGPERLMEGQSGPVAGAEKGSGVPANEKLDIVVIKLPYMSNYTDFSTLDHEPCVSLRYVREVSELGEPDLIILPGSKNTEEDIDWLNQKGFREAIQKRADPSGQAGGIPVIGICGGYQILGVQAGDRPGLGLLPVRTVFWDSKVTVQRSGVVSAGEGFWESLSGVPVRGYEIHMGRTYRVDDGDGDGKIEGHVLGADDGSNGGRDGGRDGEIDALIVTSGRVLGTYLHGIFDDPPLRNALLRLLCANKGVPAPEFHEESAEDFQERQIDLLADVLEESLDWELIHRAIGI